MSRYSVEDERIIVNGKPTFLLGVNYWPRRHPIWKMWKEFNESEIEEEAKQMASIGINAIRCFIFCEDFSKGPDRIDEKTIERLKKFIRIMYKHGIYTLPSLFVGHMSGEDWEIPWRLGRDFYRDSEVLRLESWFIQEIISRVKDEEGVLAWILSNELPLYAGRVDPDTAEIYVRQMSNVVKSVDSKRFFTTGDGHLWPGFFPPERIKDYVDYFGPHVYMQDIDIIRQTYSYGFAVKYCSSLGKPTVLEEFGCSTAYVSEENQACLFSLALFGTLINGGTGALGWCFSDFPTEDIRPYVHHHYELNFGITRTDGSEKPVTSVIKRFRKIVDKIDWSQYSFAREQAAIVVPSCLYTDYPYTHVDRDELYKLLLESFVLAKMAHIPVTFVRETEPLDEFKGYKLLLCPSLPMLLATTWSKLKEYVKSGGTLYLSYRWNSTRLDSEFLGFLHDVKFGVPDLIEEGVIKIKLKSGKEINVPVGGNVMVRSRCPIKEVISAEVMAKDDKGIVLLQNKYGRGRVMFLTIPVEYFAINVVKFHEKSELHKLYLFLRDVSGVDVNIDVDFPEVEVGVLEGDEGLIVILLNHAYSEVPVNVDVRGKVREVIDMESDERLSYEETEKGVKLRLALNKCEGRVLKITT